MPRGAMQCTYTDCTKTFSSRSHLQRHLARHEGRKDFTCPHCGKEFGRREVCNRHVALHLKPASGRPRIRPISQGQIAIRVDSAGPTTSRLDIPPSYETHTAPFDLPVEIISAADVSFPSSELLPDPASTVASCQTLAPEWDFEFDPGIQDWLNEIFDGISTENAGPSVAPPVNQQLSAAIPVSSNVDYAALLRRLHDRLRALACAADIVALLRVGTLERLVTFFWMVLNVRYPIIHKSSFKILEVNADLVLAFTLFAAARSSNAEDQQLASLLMPVLRGALLACPETSHSGRLVTLQSLLFVVLAGKESTYADDLRSHATLSYLITLGRRCSIYEERSFSPDYNTLDLAGDWLHWVEQESVRRIAWFSLVCDTEYATFFGHLPTRAESSFRQGIELPCHDACWAASSAAEWSQVQRPSLSMGAFLRNNLNPKPAVKELQLDSEFAKIVLVHGLMALRWDIDRRDLISPEVSKDSVKNFILNVLSALSHNNSPVPASPLRTAFKSALFLAQLDILINTTFLLLCAGETRLGKYQPARPSDRNEANAYITYWVSSPDSPIVVSLAADFLHTALQNEQQVPCLTSGWALYCAFLVIWAFLRRSHPPVAPTYLAIPTDHVSSATLAFLGALTKDPSSCRGFDVPSHVHGLAQELLKRLTECRSPYLINACHIIDRIA